MEKYLIMLAGFPGTGKTEAAKKLERNLENYVLISQNDIRRKMGMKKMPKAQDEVLREVDRYAAKLLTEGKGVIFDSVNRWSFRRQQMYGIASCFGINAITLECVCSEETAKKRMRSREKSDGMLSDPNDPKVYDKIKNLWEDIEIDFKYPGVNHVSYVVFDSEKMTLEKKYVTKGVGRFINKLAKILRS